MLAMTLTAIRIIVGDICIGANIFEKINNNSNLNRLLVVLCIDKTEML